MHVCVYIHTHILARMPSGTCIHAFDTKRGAALRHRGPKLTKRGPKLTHLPEREPAVLHRELEGVRRKRRRRELDFNRRNGFGGDGEPDEAPVPAPAPTPAPCGRTRSASGVRHIHAYVLLYAHVLVHAYVLIHAYAHIHVYVFCACTWQTPRMRLHLLPHPWRGHIHIHI